jgi:two-component system LytT family response regulator
MSDTRAFIADDEPLARRVVRDLLSRYDDLVVVGEAASGSEAVVAVRAAAPDLMILDVQMPDLDGFAVLHALGPRIPPAVVLVTAYDEFAVSAFDAQVADFVVKPFVDERFYQAVDRARQWLTLRDADPRRYRTRLMASAGLRAVSFPVVSIAWIEADDYYVRLHVDGGSHLVRQSLRSLEHQLDPRIFVRIHRSALVNIGYVRELSRDSRGRYLVTLRDNTRLTVGERRRRAIVQALGGPGS